MAVREDLPEPGKKEKPKAEYDQDEIEAIEQAFYRGERIKAFKRGAGLDDKPPQPQEPAIKMSLDIGKLVSDSISSLTSLAQRAQDEATKAQLDGIVKDLEHIKEKVNAPPSSSPMETYKEISELIAEIANKLKESVGIEGKITPQDLPSLIQLKEKDIEREEIRAKAERELELLRQQHEKTLEQMRMEHAERIKQWELDREEQRRRWEEEREIKLRQLEIQRAESLASREAKRKASDALEDLAGALVESIEEEKGAIAEETKTTKRQRFTATCDNCGKEIEIPEKGLERIKCPHCQQELELEWS